MKIVRLIRTLVAVVTSAVLCSAVVAQGTSITELGGMRVPSAGNSSAGTSASFAIGITTDNGLSWRNSATPTDQLRTYLLTNAGAWPRDPMDTRLMSFVASNTVCS